MAKGKYHEWITEEGLIKIEGWAREGLTDEQIAYNMGICRDTLIQWKKQYFEIAEALKNGKEVVDLKVENALFERALGGVHEVKKHIKLKETYYDQQGRKCEKEKVESVIDQIYVPGDTTAQIFWLKNRKPASWRDKVEIQDTTALERLDDILARMKETAIKEAGVKSD